MPKSSDKSLEQALATIHKNHGKEAISKAKSAEKSPPLDVIPSGSIGLDLAIGYAGRNCGIPKARVTQFVGAESSGKSTTAHHVVANAQRMGDRVAWIDAECAYDIHYAATLGVKTSELYISEPDYGEQAIDIMETLVDSGAFGLIVLDSVAALAPKAEVDGEAGDSFFGLQARLVTQFVRKISKKISLKNVALVVINQDRDLIGGMGHQKISHPGGHGLRHGISVTVRFTRIAKLKDKDNIIGALTKFEIQKNRVGPPKRTGEFDLIYGRGIHRGSELIELGLKYGLIEKDGNSYALGGERLAVGKAAAASAILRHPGADSLEIGIRAEAAHEVLSPEIVGDEEEGKDDSSGD